ncbi:hypothetical protein K443DRAFT_204413 [Laccaria amethystina LaAM-08-1]|uniref:DUF292-domain-containing protein n=1 Tax=Laccaria amethystina LaAM-08-1 TaxID=1095629 RepID=A0A0C9XQM0_9AGAR|nr:hypothetical protein K443DRAFT_204413 [Laccaria amethystina LaAM-08-1]
MPLWNAPKAKVQLRLSVQRLRTLQQKKEAQAKASRRDIAFLLEKGKIETARVKVETIINEDIHVELLELLELYCELLLARFGLLDQITREPDPGVIEGVCAIIHAAPRTELKELHILRDILMHKYGREFSVTVMENRDGIVSDRVVRKLTVAAPSSDLVNAYLAEIAKAYGVAWSLPTLPGGNDAGGGKKASQGPAIDASSTEVSSDSKSESGLGLSLPEIPTDEKPWTVKPPTSDARTANDSTSPPAAGKVKDEFEALTERFAALKKR